MTQPSEHPHSEWLAGAQEHLHAVLANLTAWSKAHPVRTFLAIAALSVLVIVLIRRQHVPGKAATDPEVDPLPTDAADGEVPPVTT